jgi:ABC-type transport system substrate-binding protein
MRKSFQSFAASFVLVLTLSFVSAVATEAIAQPRGEIRVVESWRPDINVLGHNVLQYLYEFALDRNELVPSLAVSREWIDDTTLELKLRKGVRFHNGEVFDAGAVKFNFQFPLHRAFDLASGMLHSAAKPLPVSVVYCFSGD